jgi:hypothetical protein
MPFDWRPHEQGTGTLLMAGPHLSRHKNDRPHQALFFFDEDSRPTRLMTNQNGQPLGYDLDDDNQVIDNEEALIVLPLDVATAAIQWIEAQLAAPTDT